jgi:hypothetical protein
MKARRASTQLQEPQRLLLVMAARSQGWTQVRTTSRRMPATIPIPAMCHSCPPSSQLDPTAALCFAS